MKAIVLTKFGGIENFQVEEVPTPNVLPGQVLVQIKATAFNPIDFQMRQGATESKLLASAILGREMAGEVVAVGSGVTEFKAGDAVAAYVGSLGSNGTYTQFICLPQELLAHKPQNLTFEEATAVPLVGLTALQAFERLGLSTDKSLLVTGGAGGVGTMFLQFLIANGYRQVITTAGSKASRDHLQALGIPEQLIVNYRQPHLSQTVLTLNQQQPFDGYVDLVGRSMSEVCAEVLKINGTYVDVTFLATSKAKEQLSDKGATVHHISNYAYTLSGNKAELALYGQKLQHLMNLLEKGELTAPPILTVGDLAVGSVQKAHTLLENNQTTGRNW